MAERAPSRDRCLAQVVDRVSADLQAVEIRSRVTGRPKHYHSIYEKMAVLGRDFADIYDLVGIRVLVDSLRDCYAALGTVHASESGARSVQGLRGDAQVQHVPVATHHGDRTGGKACRDSDPHLRDAPTGGVRRCRPLEVQGVTSSQEK